jgi:1-acyl-sn-glycerol-3-phosphate acyltransferase
MIFYRILLFPLALVRFVLLLIVSFFFMISVMIEDKISGKTKKFNLWSMRNWGKTLLLILAIRVKKNLINFPDKFILMPNHRSYIDIFLMAAYSPSVFVAKEELKTWPLLGPAVKAGRLILVKRDDMKSLLGTMNKIKQSIANNISVTVFPEGTTAIGPELKPFKSGTFKIAAELNIPVIPCAISYRDPNSAWVGNDNFLGHFFRQFWKPFTTAEIRFAEPFVNPDFQIMKEITRMEIESMLGEMD